MIGDGPASEFCFLCGFPFNRPKPLDEYEWLVWHEWLEHGIGFDPHRRVICLLQSDDGYGRFQIEGTQKWFCREERPSLRCEYTGQVCHLACVEFAETTIGHRLDVDAMMQLYHQSKGVQPRDYQSRVYRWYDALEVEHDDYFSSPTIEDGYSVRRRILKCLDAACMLDTRVQSATAPKPSSKPSSKPLSKPSSGTLALSIEKPPSGSHETIDATSYEHLLDECHRAALELVDLDHHQRRSRDVAELYAVAMAVGNNLVRLARACKDTNRGSTVTADFGVKIGSPTKSDLTRIRCGRLKKAECTKTPDCEWTTGVGCRSHRP